MRIHVLQHVPFEGPAAIAAWASFHGYPMNFTHLFASAKLPELTSFDMLVVMGGPMGIHDTAQFSWLAEEMDFVKRALDSGKKVLGICLGAQIMAHILGAVVSKNPQREIGWFPIRIAPSLAQPWSDWFPHEFVAFHWHGETFTLPEDAQLLGSSAACVHQGFIWKKNALALQFHLETTPASAEALIAHSSADLREAGEYVQSADTLRAGAKEHCVNLNRMLVKLLDGWVSV